MQTLASVLMTLVNELMTHELMRLPQQTVYAISTFLHTAAMLDFDVAADTFRHQNSDQYKVLTVGTLKV